ncbi:MAG: hypothetical protein WAO61_04320 [Solirubrobacterales bacterium]
MARAARPFSGRGARAVALPFTHFRALGNARRVALGGAVAIGIVAVAGVPDFGWIEATQLLLAVSALRVIARGLEDAPFPLPFHDGTLLAITGLWAVAVAAINAFDGADPGSSLIILGGCVALLLSGLRLRAYDEHYWFE